jgi:hypothetical protein
MHAFKFISLPAAAVLMLLALVQGGVAQDVEPVPLGGQCKFLPRSFALPNFETHCPYLGGTFIGTVRIISYQDVSVSC